MLAIILVFIIILISVPIVFVITVAYSSTCYASRICFLLLKFPMASHLWQCAQVLVLSLHLWLFVLFLTLLFLLLLLLLYYFTFGHSLWHNICTVSTSLALQFLKALKGLSGELSSCVAYRLAFECYEYLRNGFQQLGLVHTLSRAI